MRACVSIVSALYPCCRPSAVSLFRGRVRRLLQQSYHFHCSCPRCVASEPLDVVGVTCPLCVGGVMVPATADASSRSSVVACTGLDDIDGVDEVPAVAARRSRSPAACIVSAALVLGWRAVHDDLTARASVAATPTDDAGDAATPGTTAAVPGHDVCLVCNTCGAWLDDDERAVEDIRRCLNAAQGALAMYRWVMCDAGVDAVDPGDGALCLCRRAFAAVVTEQLLRLVSG